MPNDGGNLLFSQIEYDTLINKYPEAKKFLKKFIGADDFINNNENRYCLWLKGIDKNEWKNITPIVNRINLVRNFRLASSAQPTREKAITPELFFFSPHTGERYLLIPRVSSERRRYIPLGFMAGDTVSSDSNLIVLNANLYHFAILTSAMHMAWTRTVCGRLKSDYRYSASVVYNTFPWPTVSAAQKREIERLAEDVLAAREAHPELTLAEMYDPDKMPADLRQAHHALDMAVDALYRKKPFANDEERLQLLFALYEDLVKKK